MSNLIGKKPKSLANSLLNWSEVSQYFTGNKQNIRYNRIPKKHEEEINLLLHYFDCWERGEILITASELEQKVKDFDLITILLDKK